MTQYVLHYAPDNASLIVRLVLEDLGVTYETRLVERGLRAQESAAYRKLNPAGHIPALETPDGPISETAAIVLWLADRHGRMAPAFNAPARGAFLKWVFFLSNTLQAGMRIAFYPEKFIGDDRLEQEALRRHVQGELAKHLTLLEQEAQAGHSWFGGPEVSVFDYYLACCLRWCALYPQLHSEWFCLADFPRLFALARRLETCPAVRVAQKAEGLGPTPFSAPVLAQPPEGSAL